MHTDSWRALGPMTASLSDRCAGWDVKPVMTARFRHAAALLSQPNNIEVVHIVDEARLYMEADERDCRALAVALANHPRRPLMVNLENEDLELIAPTFEDYEIAMRFGDLYEAVEQRLL